MQTCLEAARELEVLEQEQKGATQRYETLEDQLTECRESLSQGGLERERLLSRLEQVRQQGANLDVRAEEAGRESSELQAQLTTLEQQTAERTEQVEKLRQEFTAAKDTLAEVVMRQEDLNFQLGAAEQEVESCRQSLMSVVSHAAELHIPAVLQNLGKLPRLFQEIVYQLGVYGLRRNQAGPYHVGEQGGRWLASIGFFGNEQVAGMIQVGAFIKISFAAAG